MSTRSLSLDDLTLDALEPGGSIRDTVEMIFEICLEECLRKGEEWDVDAEREIHTSITTGLLLDVLDTPGSVVQRRGTFHLSSIAKKRLVQGIYTTMRAASVSVKPTGESQSPGWSFWRHVERFLSS